MSGYTYHDREEPGCGSILFGIAMTLVCLTLVTWAVVMLGSYMQITSGAASACPAVGVSSLKWTKPSPRHPLRLSASVTCLDHTIVRVDGS